MRASTLPSPGHLRLSQQLRILAAQAISAAEQRSARTSGATSPELLAFFQACVTAVTNATPLVSIAATPTPVTVAIGATQQITVTPTPSNAAVGAVSYVSADLTKVTVSATGVITRVAAGAVNVTVTAKGKTATVVVN